ncbi:MAG: MFS transporter [Halieaceae bacterium]|jgi:DHA1 family inner membrane transport protein|nr:MFS transporter [Halieaceae bacterium]
MNPRLLSLAFAPFAFGTSAFAFVGLIVPLAEGLDIGVPLAGQLQSAFAIACGIGGPILARILAHVDRKRLLLVVMLLLLAMNVASALAPGFATIAALRIGGGLFAALTLPLASSIAVMMVPEAKRPAALATVLSGYTLAFLIGMPVATLLGESYGWRAAFWFAAAICLLSLAVIAAGTPARQAVAAAGGTDFKAAMQGSNRRLVLITLLGFCATFATVSYIGPVITAFSGLDGAAIGGVQIATGIGSLLGLPAGAMLARLPVRKALLILLTTTAITQLAYSFGMSQNLGAMALPALVVVMALGSAALFAMAPVIQTQLARTAGAAATLAFAVNGSMLYFGQGLGAGLGGSVVATSSLAWLGVAGACVAMLGVLVAMGLGRPPLASDTPDAQQDRRDETAPAVASLATD